MNAWLLVPAAVLFIAAGTVPSTAQDYWSPPVRFNPAINSEYIKERPGIARDEEEHNRCSQHRFGPFSDWSEPVWLGPVVNSSDIDEHPANSHNGLSLYISSTRPGGFGGEDIWVSQRDTVDDPWGPPQNVGPNINTAGNEFGPDFA